MAVAGLGQILVLVTGHADVVLGDGSSNKNEKRNCREQGDTAETGMMGRIGIFP